MPFFHLNQGNGPSLRTAWLLAGLFLHGFLSAQVVFSEINYHSDSVRNSGDWLELYNAGSNPVLLTGWNIRDGVPGNRWNIPSGTSLAPGAYLVVAVDLAHFAAVYPGVSNVIGQPDFRFSNSGERLALYDAGDDLVYSVTYTDSLPWQEGSDGHGRTLEVVNPLGDPNDPFNWFDGCMYGTPGRAYAPCEPPLVFSEINYNPPLSDDAGDWLELWNRSSASIDLSNWVLKDQRDTNAFVFPSGTVMPSGSYLVVCRQLDMFESVHPGVAPVLGSFGFNFSGDGEVIRLFDASGAIAFSVVFNDAVPWPQPPDGLGPTLELLDPNGPMNRYFNWFDGCPLGSPGTAFEPWCWTAGSDEPVVPELDLLVNFQGVSLQQVPYSGTLCLYTLTGVPLECRPATGAHTEQFALGTEAPGIYFLSWHAPAISRVQTQAFFWPGN